MNACVERVRGSRLQSLSVTFVASAFRRKEATDVPFCDSQSFRLKPEATSG
jgi:hypothetical protein